MTDPTSTSDASCLEPRQLEDQLALWARLCAWCRKPLPSRGRRRDQATCSKACRQAKARFRVERAAAATDRPMRFGYADPPYPGLARRYYGCDEVDHAELVDRLARDFPDGWALSTSAKALPMVLRLCPDDVRVCPWVNGERRSVARRPRVAWEPLIVYGGRERVIAPQEPCPDVLIYSGRQHSHPDALIGMKPAAFGEWLFTMLGAAPGDELVDLFPGSGAIGRAWKLFVGATDDPWHRARAEPSQPAGDDVSRRARGGRDASHRAARSVAEGLHDGSTSSEPSQLAGDVFCGGLFGGDTDRDTSPGAHDGSVVGAGDRDASLVDEVEGYERDPEMRLFLLPREGVR